MNDKALISQYQNINNKFDKQLIFRLGSEAGFFSEYNNMVFAIIYCLDNAIKFTLSSNNSNFSKIGWQEYFNEFCTEVYDEFHFESNYRLHHKPSIVKRIKNKFKKYSSSTYLTQDLWGKFHSSTFEKLNFNIKELQIHGSLLNASQRIIGITWSYNNTIKKQIDSIIDTLSLPKKYASLHIRMGDKYKETKITDPEHYVEKLTQYTDTKDIFVATDDYSVIITLQEKFPLYQFNSLTEPQAKGYDQQEFTKLNELKKYSELVLLFASIEILAQSTNLVCTYTSNIGMYLAMRRGLQYTHDVNGRNWAIW
ncbi:hypothetical protein ASE92_19250 [Pedobacter sp. Leaf41]|uniref:hypothetical protein n=1 Tax=Pedobacter sp. Leaf41 TaxID=1736218 RepID=UPI0007039DB5|nr:hypothetical protein [Pedobacter sp. Leaf41]KQN30876.1 hypothetical protein ASE92_19250 [Pedobacter sp. Leaf41]